MIGAPPSESREIVTRPDPGLARGTWEAPAWAFWAFLALVILFAFGYAARRPLLARLVDLKRAFRK